MDEHLTVVLVAVMLAAEAMVGQRVLTAKQ
jgi:hypothetical protein